MLCPKCGTELKVSLNNLDASFQSKHQAFLPYKVRCENCKTMVSIEQDMPEYDYITGCKYRVKKDYVKAKEYFKKAAAFNHVQAIIALGEEYEDEENYQKAMQQYEKAASMGDAEAKKRVGRLYGEALAYPEDERAAFQWFYEAAEQGEPAGMYHLGCAYYGAVGVTLDYEKAFFWLNKAAQHGYAMSYSELADLYHFGYGVKQDDKMAYSLLEKGAAAEVGDAKTKIALFLKEGWGVEQDPVRAYYLSMELEDDDLLEECRELIAEKAEEYHKKGCAYKKGDGVEKNLEKAIECFKKAAGFGHEIRYYAPHLELGIIYKEGLGCTKDYKEALFYFEDASSESEDGFPENQIGLIYLTGGYGVEKDEIEARKWFQKAAEKGNSDAMYNYAMSIKNVLIVPEKGTVKKDTLYWLQKASELRNVHAYNALGMLYYQGAGGVEKDYKKAYSYFEKGANEGNQAAKFNIATLLKSGLGVEKNIERALSIFEELSAQNYGKAKEQVAKCQELLAKQKENVNQAEDYYKKGCVYQTGSGVQRGCVKSKEENKNDPKELSGNLERYFDGFIGMTSVKNQLEAIYHKILAERKKQEIWKKMGRDVESTAESYNFALLGNPGTGKTVVARVISKFLHDVGIRAKDKLVETDRAGLVGEYVGTTAQKTTEMIYSAMGGTLFVDEAYSLFVEDNDKDYGKEALDTLLKQMEDKRGDFSVIMAGYKEPMMNMMRKANPGLKSRFTYIIEIPDYSDDELVEIAHSMLEKKGYKYDEQLDEAVKKCINRDRIDPKDFGNARYIRQLIDKGIENQSIRILSLNVDVPEEEYITLKGIDLWHERSDAESVEKCLEELNALTGLQSVKEQVQDLIASILTIQELEKRGIKGNNNIGSLHMVFLGNPGTGKTTVARIVGRLYSALGLLKRSNVFVEASRADLVAQYVGQTAVKVANKVSEAKGGILFIDEAYSLVKDDNDSFGKEAVDTLIKEMEDNRDNLVVILAGYSDVMERFFAISNPGLRSRVPTTLNFEDYNLDELMDIARGMLKDNYITDDAFDALREVVAAEKSQENFGNARNIRNIIEKVKRNQMSRVAKNLKGLSNEELMTIIKEDVLD